MQMHIVNMETLHIICFSAVHVTTIEAHDDCFHILLDTWDLMMVSLSMYFTSHHEERLGSTYGLLINFPTCSTELVSHLLFISGEVFLLNYLDSLGVLHVGDPSCTIIIPRGCA